MITTCANLLLTEMSSNSDIRIITADAGFGVLDQVREDFTKQFYNVGSSESLMLGIAIGMSNRGITPICFSMSGNLLAGSFNLLYNYSNSIVKMISVEESIDAKLLSALPNITVFKPKDAQELESMWPDYIACEQTAYLSLRR